MPVNRYYHAEDLRSGEEILLEQTESHHLSVATRGHTGEAVELVNGRGALAKAIVKEVDKRRGVRLKIESVQQQESPERELVLYQAFPRANRLETILEKCTELGVTEFRLFPGDRSEKGKVSKRLHTIAVGAMKQCGRLYLPKISEVPPIAKWEQYSGKMLFGDLGEGAIPFPVGVAEKENVAIVIGPESGLSPGESDALRTLGAEGVVLHKNILRTDTAAIAAVVLAAFFRDTP